VAADKTFHAPINAHEYMIGGMAEVWADELAKVLIRLNTATELEKKER